MQILLQETRKLREENNVLRIRNSPQPQHHHQRQGPCHNQGAPFPREASPTLEAHEAWPIETLVHTRHVRRGESSGSTRVSSKRQREKRPQISDAMRTRLGPKHPVETGLTPLYHWRHTPSLQARLLYKDMPPAHPWRGLVKIPRT